MKLLGSAYSADIYTGGALYQKVRKFLTFAGIPDDCDVLDAIAAGVLEDLKKKRREKNGERDRYPDLDEIYSSARLPAVFEEYWQAKKDGKEWKPKVDRSPSSMESRPPDDRDLAKLLAAISQAECDEATEYFFGSASRVGGPQASRKRHYHCYRYSEKSGYIAKSGITISAPTEQRPYCTFESTFKRRDNSLRKANGFCYQDGNWIYMLGFLEGCTLKILAVKALKSQSPPDIMEGILMSRDDQPVVARFALTRSEDQISDSTLREVPEKSDKEFSSGFFISNIRPKIRNFLNFTLQDRLLFKDDSSHREIAQKEMVHRVQELLNGKFFTQSKRKTKPRPFNPAADTHYTFNQALSVDPPGAD